MKGFAIAMLLLLAASAASGHPPYEHDIGAITTATGRIEIREGYVDGIILSDPIRFVAYSAGSNIVAATDYAWNTSIIPFGKQSFRVYQFDGPFMLFASRVWMFDSSGLQALEGFAHIMPSPLVWLWTRPISHLVLALFIALPFIFAMRNHLADLKGFAAFGGCMTTLFLAGCALCSLLINIAYLPCSLWITLDLSLLMISLVAKMKRVSNHR